MKLSELRNKVLEANEAEWFSNLQETFNFPYINFTQNFKGITAIYEFVTRQISGWDAIADQLPQEFISSKQYFLEIRDKIDFFITSYINRDANQLSSLWNDTHNSIQNISRYPFKYDLPETKFLIKLYNVNGNYFSAAYKFFIGRLDSNFSNKDVLIGTILAYEFYSKDDSLIYLRRDAEKASISKTRTDFQKYFIETETLLTQSLKNSLEKYHEYTKAIDDLKEEKELLFVDWFGNIKEAFEKYYSDATDKRSDLEKTYEELLRLQKPAEYWNRRSQKLKNEAWRYLKLMLILLGIGIVTLYFLLWLTPEGMLLSFIKGDAQAIKWSVIYITFISFLAYGVRIFHKMSFSSLHLARDAEEREQLTYVYLALIKDSKIEKEDRQLIMQSLFSRADTGLLKDDSSPTMPGPSSVVEKIISR